MGVQFDADSSSQLLLQAEFGGVGGLPEVASSKSTRKRPALTGRGQNRQIGSDPPWQTIVVVECTREWLPGRVYANFMGPHFFATASYHPSQATTRTALCGIAFKWSPQPGIKILCSSRNNFSVHKSYPLCFGWPNIATPTYYCRLVQFTMV